MNVYQLRTDIVAPVLRRLEMWSTVSEELLMATGAHESEGFVHIRQLGGGPAVSLWQIEPDTARDVHRYLTLHPDMMDNFCKAVMWRPEWIDRITERLIADQAFACAVARIRYWMEPTPLPESAHNIQAIAEYWKKYYQRGPDPQRGIQDFISDYRRFIIGPGG